MYIRSISFILLFLASMIMPLPLFLLGALAYVCLWQGYELFIIGVIVDSVYGTTGASFLYTALIGALLFIFALIRPYLSWYNTQV